MALLGLHTTSSGCHVAVLGARGITGASAPQASSALPGLALEVLARAGEHLAALDGIAVACGPGSFTGIKIGLASAWGLGRPAGLRLLGVGSLDTLAVAGRCIEHGRAGAGVCVAVAGAYAGMVYAARFLCGDEPEDVTLDGEYRAGKPAELLPEMLTVGAQVVMESTPLAEVAAPVLDSFLPVRVMPSDAFAQAVVRLAQHRYSKGLQQEARALYLRADPAKAW